MARSHDEAQAVLAGTMPSRSLISGPNVGMVNIYVNEYLVKRRNASALGYPDFGDTRCERPKQNAFSPDWAEGVLGETFPVPGHSFGLRRTTGQIMQTWPVLETRTMTSTG